MPGRMWTLPCTTETGTHSSSRGNRACFCRSRDWSMGSSTILNLAFLAGESSSQLKFGWDGLGFEMRFIRSNASWWRTRGRPKALAMDWYVMSSCLYRLVRIRDVRAACRCAYVGPIPPLLLHRLVTPGVMVSEAGNRTWSPQSHSDHSCVEQPR